MQLLLKEMRPGLTVHGFRTSFRDWISEDTDFNGDLGEFGFGACDRRSVETSLRAERSTREKKAGHASVE
jgi:hypothetical protein